MKRYFYEWKVDVLKKILLSLALVIITMLVTQSIAWAGSGNVDKYGTNDFYAFSTGVEGEPINFYIHIKMTMRNSFTYSNGVQDSKNHQLFGIYEKKDDLNQSIGSSMSYYENGKLVCQPSKYGACPSVYVPPGWKSWGWSNTTTTARNYYPGGPDFVNGVCSWFGRTFWDSIAAPNDPNKASLLLYHIFR